MGLDTTHDAFHGAYSAFNRLRQAVAEAIGGSYPPHQDPSLHPKKWYWGAEYSRETHRGLHEFMDHSDCDGDISPEMCIKVAHDLETLLPKLDEMPGATGHLQEGYGVVTRRFILGCRRAAAANEPLKFR